MSEKTYRLRAPPGTDECNHGPNRYVVRDGIVDVPSEAIEPLCRVGGFTLLGPSPDPAPVIEPPSAEFVAEVGEALHALGEAATPAPSPTLVAEVVRAIAEVAAKPAAAPATLRLVIPA